MAEIKRRAVSPAQKEKRRQDILNSAKTLFNATQDYNGLLMKHIAENISLTKGTLYLYFKTKEEVFLALYTQEFNRVFDHIDVALQTEAGKGSVDKLVTLLCEQLTTEQTFLRLNSMLHTVLEQNIDFDTALAFKTLLRDRLLNTGRFLAAYLPPLSPLNGAEILLSVHELLIGSYQAAAPTPFLDEIFEREDMRFMKLDFAVQFPKNLRWLLQSAYADMSAQVSSS